ncbi:UNVERIFIED_CONTAM: hypothetical protein FKN15_070052 [Acipenser sinensis]
MFMCRDVQRSVQDLRTSLPSQTDPNPSWRRLSSPLGGLTLLPFAHPRAGEGCRPLLDVPISPGHTFGPAVAEILQRYHREREASRQVAAMLPSRAPARGRGRRWCPSVTTVTWTIPIPTGRPEASMAAYPAYQRPGRQLQRNHPRQPPRQSPAQPQQPQQGP